MSDEGTICGSEDITTERLRMSAARGIITDWQDAWLLGQYLWYVDDNGYAATNIAGRKVYLHHCIVGQPITGEVVDHEDKNPCNNKRHNLLYKTHAANLRNNNHPLGVSGHRGIVIVNGKYLARVNWNGTTYHLGTFDTLDEAVAERDEWLSMR